MKSAKSIYYLIGAIILLIIVNTVFFLYQSSVNEGKYYAAKNSSMALKAITTLMSSLKDAETAQRGYLITGEPKFIAHTKSAEKRINKFYYKYYSITKRSNEQKAGLNRLKSLINAKLTEVRQTIKLKQNGNEKQAFAIVNLSDEKAIMPDIRRAIAKLIAADEASLAANFKDVEQSNFQIQIFSVFSNWILLIVVVISLLNITRNREQINTLFYKIDKKNDLLVKQKNELQYLSHDLIRQNADLERFAYVASHDLRSPAINMNSLLSLYNEAKNEGEKQVLIEVMQEISENLMLKLNDLVDIMKNKHTSNELIENLSLIEVYDKVVKNLSGEILKSKAHLDYDFSAAPNINCYGSYMESILQNLISNALKYSHPERKPEIMIRSYQDKKNTYVKIADNGLGIDLNIHGSSLFGLYKTFHQNKDSKGVGLYLTKAQILAMGGHIEVDSKPGVGTTFTICL